MRRYCHTETPDGDFLIRSDFMDSYEYTDPMYINGHQFYHRHKWCTTDEDVQRWRKQELEESMGKPKWYSNIDWITEQLRIVDGIRYEDLPIKRIAGKAPYLKMYNGVLYDVSDARQTIMLYGAITGKPQKIMDVDEYVAERRKKNERTNVGTH